MPRPLHSIKPSRRLHPRRSFDPWTSQSTGAAHYESLQRGLLFFMALFSLAASVAVAAHCCRLGPEEFAATRLAEPVSQDTAPSRGGHFDVARTGLPPR